MTGANETMYVTTWRALGFDGCRFGSVEEPFCMKSGDVMPQQAMYPDVLRVFALQGFRSAAGREPVDTHTIATDHNARQQRSLNRKRRRHHRSSFSFNVERPAKKTKRPKPDALDPDATDHQVAQLQQHNRVLEQQLTELRARVTAYEQFCGVLV